MDNRPWGRLIATTVVASIAAGIACIPFYYLLVAESLCGSSFLDLSFSCSQSTRTQYLLIAAALVGIVVTTFFVYKLGYRWPGHWRISYLRLFGALVVASASSWLVSHIIPYVGTVVFIAVLVALVGYWGSSPPSAKESQAMPHRFCTVCGASLGDSARFCSGCGSAV